MSGDDEGKDHDASQKKLDDARGRGDVARSADLTVAAGFAGLTFAAMALGPQALLGFGGRARAYLDQIDRMARMGGSEWGISQWALALTTPVLPFLLLPGVAALLCILAQRGLVFSGEKLAPKLARLDPIANAKHRFGRSGLVDFLKSTAKLLLVGALLGWFLVNRLPVIFLSLQLPAAPVAALLTRLMVDFLILIVLVLGGLGALDYLWQRLEHLRRNRMSRQEVVEEFRQSEGDPHVKSQRRQRAQAIAMNRMLADVPKADVVLVNPTHYAVALKWARKSGRAPVCLAKGTDEVAARIRAAAATAGVPIHSDPPTARALYATLKIGQEIRPEHYAPVAAAIRFAETMRKKARERRGG